MSRQAYLVFGALLLSASMWIWVQAIAIPRQQAESAELGIPRGNLSDLYPRWLGAREMLLRGRDPYDAGITREIQIGYYGRPLDPKRPNDPKDQQAFAYPIYVVLMLAPTVTIPFSTVQRVFLWLLIILLAASVPLWLRALGWRLSRTAIVAWIVLTFGCFPAIQGLKLQQLTILVFALIAGSMTALVRGRFLLAGFWLALATIKPQLVFFLVLWLCIWTVGRWRERQRLLWGFFGTIAVLVVAGEFLLPGWIGEFRTAMRDYYRYTGGGFSVLDVALSPMWGRFASALIGGMLVVLVWQSRRASEETAEFQWSLAFTLATTLLVIPTFAIYNQLLLLPGAMMAMRARRELWQKSRFVRFFCSVASFSVGWPFLAAACLVVALTFLPGATVQKAWGLPFYPSFAIPITVYALMLVSREVLSSGRAQHAMVDDPRGLRHNATSE